MRYFREDCEQAFLKTLIILEEKVIENAEEIYTVLILKKMKKKH